jgi:hypothetical protein
MKTLRQSAPIITSLGIACLWLVLATPAFAAGGACPTAANYIDPTNPSSGGGLGSVTLASQGVTSCFYISSSGLDSNTGTTEAAPWLHAPGMSSCSSTCAGVTPTAGEGFIFEGGSQWHYGTGTPLIGGSGITVSQSGSSGSPLYYGVDPTWFSGGSFARPIFNQDNPLSTSTVSSCTFSDTGTAYNVTGSFVITDGFEFTGNCLPSGSNSTFSQESGNHNIDERLYIHGWTVPTGFTSDLDGKIGQPSNSNPGTPNNNRTLFSVIDGVDSSLASCNSPSCIDQSGNGVLNHEATGWGIGDGEDVEYSIIRHTSQGIQAGNICVLIGDLFEYIFEPDTGAHGNVLEAVLGNNAAGYCSTFIAYRDVTRFTDTGETWNPSSSNYFIFNSTWTGPFGHSFGTPPTVFDPNCLELAGDTNGSNTVTAAHLYNNTHQQCEAYATASNSTTGGWASGSTIALENEHVMDFTSPVCSSGFWAVRSGSSATCTDNGGEVFQTTSVANGQGYTTSNTYAPTSGSNATVGAGNNNTSFCSGLSGFLGVSSARVQADCKTATSEAVSEISSWGGEFASYPTITVNTRPSSGAWDAGAYEFTSSGAATQPSCTPGTGSYSSSQTVTCTNPNSGTTVMCFTTTGTTPVTNGAGTACTTGTKYTTTITVSSSETLEVVAGTSTLTDSSIASYAYTIQYAVTLTVPFTGASISDSGGGIVACNSGISPCSATYNQGTVDTFTVTPSTNYGLASWGGACSGSGSCSVTLNAAEAVTANIAQIYAQLPQYWNDPNELLCPLNWAGLGPCFTGSPGLSLNAPSAEFNTLTQTWVTGPPSGCTFHNPYWTVGTPVFGAAYTGGSCSSSTTGLQGAVCDIEACRTTKGGSVGIILDVDPVVYSTAASGGLIFPQSSSSLATAPLILRSTSFSQFTQGIIPCVNDGVLKQGGLEDNVSESTAIAIDNYDCSGNNMTYQLGTLSAAVTAASGASGTATITSTLHPAVGRTVTLVNMTPVGYNTSGTVTSTSSSSFQFAFSTATTACTAFSEVGTTVTATCTGFSPGVNSALNMVATGSTPSGYTCTGCTATASTTNTVQYTAATSGLAAGTTGTALVVGATAGTAFGSASVGNITPVSPGAFTLANGVATNTANYATSQYMWQIQSTASLPYEISFCSPTATGTTPPPCQSTTLAPDHWQLEGFAASASPGNKGAANIVQMEAANETAVSQLPSHIHLRHFWLHGDWAETAAGLQTGANSTSTALLFGCNECTAGDAYFSELVSPGAEGHCIAPSYGTAYHLYNIYSSGCGIGFIAGGFSSLPTINGGNYVPSQDVHMDRIVFKWPYDWLGQLQVTGNTNWPTNPSLVRKNAGPEFKTGNRILLDGIVCENVDQSGGQGGPCYDNKVTNNSSGPGTYYAALTANLTHLNEIWRNTCNGIQVLGKSDAGSSAGAGASHGIGWPTYFNILNYNMSVSNPGCAGSGTIGQNFQSANGQWEVNITVSSGIATAQGMCAPLTSGNCPTGPPTTGAQQMDINQGDGFIVTGCTGNTGFNSPTQVIAGHTLPMLFWVAAANSSTVTIGSNTYPIVTFATTQTASDTTQSCLLDYISSWPSHPIYKHVTSVTDLAWGITTGDSVSTNPPYATYALFRDSIQLGSCAFLAAVGEGSPTQKFMFDTTTLTFDHMVCPTRTASYLEFGNNNLFPAGPCTTLGGCTPSTVYFPTNSNCTGSTVSNCVGFTNSMSTSVQPGANAFNPVSDYHGFTLLSSSPYFAGGANDASDGTSMGANIPAIDTALTSPAAFNCVVNGVTLPCGSPGPFPDNLTPTAVPSVFPWPADFSMLNPADDLLRLWAQGQE